jgi:hypothetical protein
MHLRKRAPLLWDPVTDPVSSGIYVSFTMEPGSLPILQEAQLLSIPFKLKDLVHPNIPKSMKGKKGWTDMQRAAITLSRPYTVRCTAEFVREVSMLCTSQFACMLTLTHTCRWKVFFKMASLQATNSFACQGHSQMSMFHLI